MSTSISGTSSRGRKKTALRTVCSKAGFLASTSSAPLRSKKRCRRLRAGEGMTVTQYSQLRDTSP